MNEIAQVSTRWRYQYRTTHQPSPGLDPHFIGIIESWANTDISDTELGLSGYVMFRKDRTGRRAAGVIVYI
ncbi:MAG: hypothetical protein M3H12_01070, partial [Chromatiales bacterium]